VVDVAGFGHVDLIWEDPVWAAFLERLASFSRLILFDRRGTGASAGIPDTAMPTWEEWADDVRAVLDAARSEAVKPRSNDVTTSPYRVLVGDFAERTRRQPWLWAVTRRCCTNRAGRLGRFRDGLLSAAGEQPGAAVVALAAC
jgi:hypothetical protein